jgi:hypothetical protein
MALYSSDWAKRWQKAKPRTLVGDKLTEPLQALDKMIGKWVAEGPGGRNALRLPKFAALVAAAQKGARETRAKCNKVMHAQGIAYLDTVIKDLDLLAKDIQRHEKDYQTVMTQIRKCLVGSAQALTTMVNQPDLAHARQAVHTCQANNKASLDVLQRSQFSGTETRAASQALNRAEITARELAAALEKKSMLPAGQANRALDVAIAENIDEAKRAIKGLRDPVKHNPPIVDRSTGKVSKY